MRILAWRGSFLAGRSLPPAQGETGATRECAIQQSPPPSASPPPGSLGSPRSLLCSSSAASTPTPPATAPPTYSTTASPCSASAFTAPRTGTPPAACPALLALLSPAVADLFETRLPSSRNNLRIRLWFYPKCNIGRRRGGCRRVRCRGRRGRRRWRCGGLRWNSATLPPCPAALSYLIQYAIV